MFFLFAIIPLGLMAKEEMVRCPDASGLNIKDPYGIEVFVLIDQTTFFSDEIRQNIERNLLALIRPGTVVHIIAFSTYSSTHHTSLVMTERISRALSEKETYNLAVKGVKQYDRCISAKEGFLKKKALDALNGIYRKKGEDVSRSDILWAFHNISKNAIASSVYKTKIALIASDMLENSSLTSFYSGGAMRKINPEQELKKVKNDHLLGDFGNSFIFVIGTGVVESDKGVYRDYKTMGALRSFWESYFSESNGKLVAMGMPILERTIGE